jgi:hypothetical protein
MGANLIHPGGQEQFTDRQIYAAIMRQLEQMNNSMNVLSVKLQALQNTVIAKDVITVAELETEWHKVVEEVKKLMSSAIVSPDGQPVMPDAKTEITVPESKKPAEPEATPPAATPPAQA